ncbi:MAG: prepilin-type N-terminal cleavage/methylation domain-containing protein [Chromatiales bacterium]|nr:prepilin-type N-terminal cleavage/methylation domain-containing protein [Chromatiales bacterium]
MRPGHWGRSDGFTLIELLVAVVVAAILAVVAYPAYQEQIHKVRRTEAKSTLVDLANKLQKFYYDNGSYTGSGDSDDVLGVSQSTPDGLYSIAHSTGSPSASAYVIKAQVKSTAAQADDDACTVFTLSSTGAQSSYDSEGNTADCW